VSLAYAISARLLALEARAFLRLRCAAELRMSSRQQARGRPPKPDHLRTGERGEDLAYFRLRELGYTVVARRWHSARLKGDLDLVGWDGDTLVIFEVKTRTARDLAPAETAVDAAKQRMLRRMALAYRRRLPEPWRDVLPVRFDVVSVYDLPGGQEFEHTVNAFPLTDRGSTKYVRSGV
jgi:putative endonuclease